MLIEHIRPHPYIYARRRPIAWFIGGVLMNQVKRKVYFLMIIMQKIKNKKQKNKHVCYRGNGLKAFI